jgi:c-di-AMP phosphodiesterase-like protein
MFLSNTGLSSAMKKPFFTAPASAAEKRKKTGVDYDEKKFVFLIDSNSACFYFFGLQVGWRFNTNRKEDTDHLGFKKA